MDVKRHAVACTLSLAMLILPGPAPAQEEAAHVIDAEMELATEYDDNVGLASGEGASEEKRDDFVLHAKPVLKAERAGKRHLFSLAAAGDFRQGLDSDLSELNMNAAGSADFTLRGGLGFGVYDEYVRTRFDQAVLFTPEDLATIEPGIATSDSNAIGAQASWSPKRLFELEGGYETADEEFGFGSGDTAQDDERDVDTVTGRLTVPVVKGLKAFAMWRSEDQEGPQRLTRIYDDERKVAGLEWDRGKRLSLRAEAGTQSIDFAETPGVEYDNTVGLVGAGFAISEDTTVQASIGVDAFEETIWDLLAERTPSQGGQMRLRVRKLTQPAFSIRTVGTIYEATIATVGWQKPFGERMRGRLELSYLKLESSSGALVQDEKTGVGVLRFERDLKPWLRSGAYFRYARRDSNLPAQGFTENRFALFLLAHN